MEAERSEVIVEERINSELYFLTVGVDFFHAFHPLLDRLPVFALEHLDARIFIVRHGHCVKVSERFFYRRSFSGIVARVAVIVTIRVIFRRQLFALPNEVEITFCFYYVFSRRIVCARYIDVRIESEIAEIVI